MPTNPKTKRKGPTPSAKYRSTETKLREVRLERQLTLTEIARLSNVAIGTVWFAETGQRKTSLLAQWRIARALHMTRQELFPDV